MLKMNLYYSFVTLIGLLQFTVDIVYCSDEKDIDRVQLQINGIQPNYELGSDLQLTCGTSRQLLDSEKVTWSLNNTHVLSNERISVETKNCSNDNGCSALIIRCLDLSDVGDYTCQLYETDNKIATVVSSPYFLTIDVPVVVKTENVVVKANENASLKCTFKGVSSETVKWSKINDDTITEQLKNNVDTIDNKTLVESILTLNSVNLRNNNGTYRCSASKSGFETFGFASLIVRDIPDVTIHTVRVVGPNQIFLNWTVNDGNDKMESYFIQYLKNGTNDWTYYGESIGGANTSYILKNLERGSTYKLKIHGKNSIGQSAFREYPYNVTTLKEDVVFIPEPYVKGITGNSIEIGWSPPPPDLKEHIHFYKLCLRNNETREEAVQHVDRSNAYMFINLHFAEMYFIKISACNEFTHDCGNWSKEINGTTLDGVSDPPKITNISCKYDNISGSSLIRVDWSPPEHINGEITYYNVSLIGTANFYNEDGELKNVTWIPDFRTTKLNFIIFERVLPNTNYSISVSVKTRNNVNGKQAVTHCIVPPTVPSKERLNSIKWETVEEQDKWFLKLFIPRISERNGTICCYRIFLIRLEPEQGLADLPSPKETTVFTYQYVHKSAKGGGAYIADMFDNNFINKNIVLGDGKSITKDNVSSHCYKCLNVDPKIVSVGGNNNNNGQQQVPVATSTSSLAFSSISTSSSASGSNATKFPIKSMSHRSNEKFIIDDEEDDAKSVAATVVNNASSSYSLNNTVYDGLLDKNSNYTGFLQLIVYGTDNKLMTTYSNYFDILKPGPQMFFDQHQELEILSFLFQVLIAFGCIAFVILIGFCMLQHYTRQVAEAQGVEMTLRNSFRHLCRSLRGSHIPVSSNPPDVLPISKVQLVVTYTELSKDSDYGFEQEFEMLPDRFTDRTTKASEARENVCKNRYPDIKAYDQTRVKLSQIDGIIGSDYINANFVVGYKERKKFICAQGPMDNTVCDFWRMIWEQQLEIILMLTNLEEYSKTKCAKYWPDKEEQSKTFGDINVHYITEKRYSDYVIRELKVIHNSSEMKEPEERSIYQYHFLVWKDFQAPEHPSGILKFIKRVNEAYSYEKGPILVHCSAGVGRTGTLVALDSLLQQLESEGQILVFNTICDLRHQRNFLVQSLKQYIFVYRTLLEYAQFGDTEIRAIDLRAAIENLKQCDNGKIKTRMEEEFERLSFTLNNQEVKSTAVGSAAENGPKNGDSFIIPYDRNRVILTPVPACEHSTYINASFIEGYDNSESFIITQDPILETTVVDFWRMISEQNINTIVMLSSLLDGQNRCPRYWPDEELLYGNVNVKHVQSESCPYFTRREFYVTNVKMDENLVVVQYQYNGWPTVEGEVPEVTRGLIELVDNTTMKNCSSFAADVGEIVIPIVVHCDFGSDRSSMFVGLSILAQQIKTEKRVDVATMTRKLRSQRRGMLSTFAQYEFLYRAILNYADLHHLATTDAEFIQ